MNSKEIKNISVLFANLVKEYGENNSLDTFNLCSDYVGRFHY